VRAYPKSGYVPKPMLEIGGTPLVQRNLELLRDALGIREIVVIVGYLGDQIRKHLGDGSAFDVKIRYVECEQPDIGLAQGVALAEPLLQRPFATILADELYIGSNHAELRAPDDDYFNSQVLPLFVAPAAFGSDVACIACHASFRDPPSFNEVNLTSHEAIMRGAFSRTNKTAGKTGIPIVVPFDAANSRIYQRLTENRMPPGIGPNEESDHPNTSLLMRWIEQGAWCR